MRVRSYIIYGLAITLTFIVTLWINTHPMDEKLLLVGLYGGLLLWGVPFLIGLIFDYFSWWRFALVFVVARMLIDLSVRTAMHGWRINGPSFAYYAISTLLFGYLFCVAACYVGFGIRKGMIYLGEFLPFTRSAQNSRGTMTDTASEEPVFRPWPITCIALLYTVGSFYLVWTVVRGEWLFLPAIFLPFHIAQVYGLFRMRPWVWKETMALNLILSIFLAGCFLFMVAGTAFQFVIQTKPMPSWMVGMGLKGIGLTLIPMLYFLLPLLYFRQTSVRALFERL